MSTDSHCYLHVKCPLQTDGQLIKIWKNQREFLHRRASSGEALLPGAGAHTSPEGLPVLLPPNLVPLQHKVIPSEMFLLARMDWSLAWNFSFISWGLSPVCICLSMYREHRERKERLPQTPSFISPVLPADAHLWAVRLLSLRRFCWSQSLKALLMFPLCPEAGHT